MVEPGSRLPGLLRMATGAIAAKLAPMPVLVAGEALAAKAEERVIQILDLDLRAGAGGDPLFVVAGLALLFAMFAFERKSGLSSMIEAPALQTGENKSTAVMFHMTACTIGLRARGFVGAPVKTGAGIDPAADFGVTVQASEAARANTEIVARGAFGDTLQLLVRAR